MREIEVGVLGIGGYARTHHQALERCGELGLGRTAAVVVHAPELYPEEYERIRRSGARLYESYGEMFAAEEGRLGLVTIPTGINDHRRHATAALEAGFHVFCEKPAAGTVSDAQAMREAARSSGLILAVGYQQIVSPTIQRLKGIRVQHELGELLEARTYGCWPRSSSYYARNSWAGRMLRGGEPVFDSPLQNAMSHFLQNMLYIAGSSHNESAVPVEIYGENYRAKEIESADTQFIRLTTAEGPVLKFAATHACRRQINPVTDYYFRRGRARWHHEGRCEIFYATPSGERKVEEFDNGAFSPKERIFFDTLIAIGERRAPLSSIENSWQHTAAINALFDVAPVVPVDDGVRVREPWRGDWSNPEAEGVNVVIDGIEELMEGMFKTGRSFHESGAAWADAGGEGDVPQ